ncbi:hypothetical protein AUC69_15820 [Methyloceanibacter superfactus]|uniref:Uncharacterized protein n=1 Tax=Methyloceanibacter superfactus TaxID=1774969 RepID=A0A1E3VRD3_9HYPH|nr:hypothetical protein AUC69_15820 [Methyloceanibacter superfactus]
MPPRLQLQAQPVAIVSGQRKANEASALARHEVYRLGRGVLGKHHEIAFVLAIGIVDQDNHAAAAQIVHGLRYCAELIPSHAADDRGSRGG